MDVTGLVGVIAVVLGLLISILFGAQYSGILPWLRRARKKENTHAPVVVPAGEAPATQQVQPAAAQVTTQTTTPSEPINLVVSRALAERNQPKAARWALLLPALMVNVGILAYTSGFLVFLAGAMFGPIGKPVTSVALPLMFLSMFLNVAAGYSPVIILVVSNIVYYIRELMA